MKLKILNILLLLLFLFPLTFAYSPNFLQSSVHYFGEQINFGLSGTLPMDTNYIQLTISDDQNLIFSQNIDVTQITYIFYIFPPFIDTNLFNVVYSFFNDSNNLIDSKRYELFLLSPPIISNYFFCNNLTCSESKTYFYETEDIYLMTSHKNLAQFFDINIFDYNNVQIYSLTSQSLPLKLTLSEGFYTFNINANYNNHIFPKTIFLNIVDINYVPEDLFAPVPLAIDVNEGLIDFSVQGGVNTPSDSQDITESIDIQQPKKDFTWVYIIIIIIIILAIILISSRKQQETPRRLQRKIQMFFILFILCIFFIPQVHADNQTRTYEYKDLEISYDSLTKLFPTPKIINLYITPSSPINSVVVPLIFDEDIKPVIENPNISSDGKITVNLLDVYLLDKNKYITFINNFYKNENQGNEIPSLLIDAKEVLEYYKLHPIETKLELYQRTKQELEKQFDKDAINYLIYHNILVPKKILMQIAYNSTSPFSKEQNFQTNVLYDGFFVNESSLLNINYINDGLIAYIPSPNNQEAIQLISQEKGWDTLPLGIKDINDFQNVNYVNYVIDLSPKPNILNNSFLIYPVFTNYSLDKKTASFNFCFPYSFSCMKQDIILDGKINLGVNIDQFLNSLSYVEKPQQSITMTPNINKIATKAYVIDNYLNLDIFYLTNLSEQNNVSITKLSKDQETQIKSFSIKYFGEKNKQYLFKINNSDIVFSDQNYSVILLDELHNILNIFIFKKNNNGFDILYLPFNYNKETFVWQINSQENNTYLKEYNFDKKTVSFNLYETLSSGQKVIKDIISLPICNEYILEANDLYIFQKKAGQFVFYNRQSQKKSIPTKKFYNLEMPIFSKMYLTEETGEVKYITTYAEGMYPLNLQETLPDTIIPENIQQLYLERQKYLDMTYKDEISIQFIAFDKLRNVLQLNIDNILFEYDYGTKKMYSPLIEPDLLDNINLIDIQLPDPTITTTIYDLKNMPSTSKKGKLKVTNFLDNSIDIGTYNIYFSPFSKYAFDDLNYNSFTNTLSLPSDYLGHIYLSSKNFSNQTGDSIINLQANIDKQYNIVDCNFIPNTQFSIEFLINNKQYNFPSDFKDINRDDFINQFITSNSIFQKYFSNLPFNINFLNINNNEIYTVIIDDKNDVIKLYRIIPQEFKYYTYVFSSSGVLDITQSSKYDNGVISSLNIFDISYVKLKNITYPTFSYNCVSKYPKSIKKTSIPFAGTYTLDNSTLHFFNYMYRWDLISSASFEQYSQEQLITPIFVPFDFVFEVDSNGSRRAINVTKNSLDENKSILIDNKLIDFDTSSVLQQNLNFSIELPISFKSQLANNNASKTLFSTRSQIIQALKTQNNKYDYLLLIGDKYQIPELSNISWYKHTQPFENTYDVFPIDYYYANRIPFIEEEWFTSHYVNVGRLPFSDKNSLFSYFTDLPFIMQENADNIFVAYSDNKKIILPERDIYDLLNLGVSPVITIYNSSSSPVSTLLDNDNYNSMYPNLKYIIDPDTTKLISYILAKDLDTFAFHTHGSPFGFATANGSFKSIYLPTFKENRLGVFARSCNTGIGLGETMIKYGAKYYAGYVLPAVSYESLYLVGKDDDATAIGELLTNYINYYHSYYPDAKQYFPFILLGDPSIFVNTFDVTVPTIDSSVDQISIIFPPLNKNIGYIQDLHLSSQYNKNKYNASFIAKNYFYLDANLQQLLVNKEIGVVEDYFKDQNVGLWKAIGLINTNGNNYYLIQEVGYPLYYNISDAKFNEKYDSYFKKNMTFDIFDTNHFAEIYINNKFILKTKEPIVYSVNTEHRSMYFSITFDEFFDLVKEGIFEYPWEIRVS